MAQAKLPPNPVPLVRSTRPQQAAVNLGRPPERPYGDQQNAKIVTVGRPAASVRQGG